MSRLLLVLGLVVSVFSACGGADPGINDAAARSLEPRIAQVRAAAEARQPDVVRARLAELRSEVEALRRQGRLTEAGAARIVGAVGGVEDNLMLITSTTTAPRPTTTLPRRPTTSQPRTQPDRKEQEEKPEEDEKKKEEDKKD